MEENRDRWNAWSDAFQAAWNADIGPDELPPAPIGCGPGWPADRLHEPLPALDGIDVAVLGCGGGHEAVGFARFEGDRFAELHFYSDFESMMGQLGLMPESM